MEDLICHRSIFLNIIKFINKKQIALISITCKKFYEYIQAFFKQFLEQKFFYYPNQNFSIEEKNYIKIYHYYFQREVLVSEIDQITPKKYIKSSQEEGIIKFQKGRYFSTQYHRNQDLLIYESNDEIKIPFMMKSLIQQFSVIGHHLIYLDNLGQLFILFYSENKPYKEKQFNFEQKIIKFYERYIYLIIQFEDQSLKVFLYNDVLPEQIQDKYRYRNIQKIENLINFGVGINQCFFLDAKNQVYFADLSIFTNENYTFRDNNEIIPIQKFEYFENKKIVQIFCGLYFFFALERHDTQSIKYWTNQQVLEWASQIPELQEYMKILKYQQVTGEQLQKFDKKYLDETLGFKKQTRDMIEKELKKFQQNTIKEQVLYGWGQNNQGQLCIDSIMNVLIPKKVRLPELNTSEKIQKIICGWKNSIMLTNEGRVFINQKPIKIDKPKVRNSNFIKKQRDNNHLWNEITHHFSILRNRKQFFIKNIFLGKTQIFAVGIYKGLSYKKSFSDDIIIKEKRKTLTAEKVLSKIQWSPNVNEEDFIIGYKTKSGNDELRYNELTTMKYFPESITYFKFDGKIVWDKKTMISHI